MGIRKIRMGGGVVTELECLHTLSVDLHVNTFL